LVSNAVFIGIPAESPINSQSWTYFFIWWKNILQFLKNILLKVWKYKKVASSLYHNRSKKEIKAIQ